MDDLYLDAVWVAQEDGVVGNVVVVAWLAFILDAGSADPFPHLIYCLAVWSVDGQVMEAHAVSVNRRLPLCRAQANGSLVKPVRRGQVDDSLTLLAGDLVVRLGDIPAEPAQQLGVELKRAREV